MFVMLVAVKCLASLPPYGSFRELIEEYTPKDKRLMKPCIFGDVDND